MKRREEKEEKEDGILGSYVRCFMETVVVDGDLDLGLRLRGVDVQQ
jgi:hypothetical protein